MTEGSEVILHAGALTLVMIDKSDLAKVLVGAAIGSTVSEVVGGALAGSAGDMAKNGQGVLTNYRFVFGTGKSLKKPAIGGPLLYDNKTQIDLEVPLQAITSVTRGKQGFSPLFIVGTDSGRDFKFSTIKTADCDNWAAAINKAIGK